MDYAEYYAREAAQDMLEKYRAYGDGYYDPDEPPDAPEPSLEARLNDIYDRLTHVVYPWGKKVMRDFSDLLSEFDHE
jgi:hypothetical protein